MESQSLKNQLRKHEGTPNIKKGILLVILATFCTATGLTLLKIGIGKYAGTIPSMLNVPFIGGIILYGISAILLILGLKEGNLSTLYPLISLSYVWVIAISIMVFNEPLQFVKALGSAAIILGVALLGVKGDAEIETKAKNLSVPKRKQSNKKTRRTVKNA